MKIFRCDQIRDIDSYTVTHEPVSSTDLMERAAGKLFEWLILRYDSSRPVIVFAGSGNNGGDGLALARMLAGAGYITSVFFAGSEESATEEWRINKRRLEEQNAVPFVKINDLSALPLIQPESLIVDAIFGSGLNRKVTGIAADAIKAINLSEATVVAVDIPSGLFGEDNSANDPDLIVKADYTLTFQFPKLSFMFPGNDVFTGEWIVLPIGLHPEAIEQTETPFALITPGLIRPLLKGRSRFAHKGNFGHGLLVSGSCGKMGAAVLGARAALRSGIGLLTCHIPRCGNEILQTAVPEAMTLPDQAENFITAISDSGRFSACGAGPGMGTGSETEEALRNFLVRNLKPLVLDADALNIISANREILKLIPPLTVMTPHPGEFERLAGKSDGGFDRLMKQIRFSSENNCIVVLKGAFTSVSHPSGKVWFNTSGNPGMATAGSGDVLTGMILSLLARGYDPLHAALSGVFIHGLAGDIAVSVRSPEALIASDVIECIGEAFNRIRKA